VECLESSASDRRPLPKYPDGREDPLEQELHNLASKHIYPTCCKTRKWSIQKVENLTGDRCLSTDSSLEERTHKYRSYTT
jgi:hypothetical protein